MELAVILRDYSQQLEAELLKLGVDLRDMESDERFTIRRLWIMYIALGDKNLVTLAAGKLSAEERQWNTSDYILANVFDAVQNLVYITQVINTKKGHPAPKQPAPHPRPGRVKRRQDMRRLPIRPQYTPD